MRPQSKVGLEVVVGPESPARVVASVLALGAKWWCPWYQLLPGGSPVERTLLLAMFGTAAI